MQSPDLAEEVAVASLLDAFSGTARFAAALMIKYEAEMGSRLGPNVGAHVARFLRLSQAELRQAWALAGYLVRPGVGYADFFFPREPISAFWFSDLSEAEQRALAIHRYVDRQLLN